MPLSIAPKYPNLRERILAFGNEGTGKSRAVCSIIKRIPDHFFRIIDNDDSYERLIYSDEFEVIAERGNFELIQVDSADWEAQLAAAQRIADEAVPGDWNVFDCITPTWTVAINDWYTNLIFDKGLVDYAIAMRQSLEDDRSSARDKGGKEKRTQPLFDQFRDYGVINPAYKKLYSTFLNTRAHVFLTATVTNVRDSDDIAIKKVYGSFRPEGQKDLGKMPHTALLFRHNPGRGEWTFETKKDRQREYVEEVEFTDFSKEYLIDVAGWRVKKVA